MAFDRKNLHSYTSIDFCLDEIGKIDWVNHFVNLKELTVVNQSVTEIEVSHLVLIKNREFKTVAILRRFGLETITSKP